MASTQCYKPVEQTPSQTQSTTKTQAYYGQTQTTAHTNHVDQNKVHGHGLGHTRSSNGKKRSEHEKRGLFQKLRDALSGGHSGSSSSDSESDDEHSGRRRASHG